MFQMYDLFDLDKYLIMMKKLIVTLKEMSKNKQFFKWSRKERALNKLKIFSSLSY